MALTKITDKQVTYKHGGTGSASRSLTSKLNEVVSVKDFGATGDGVTDDSVAIQAALTASSNVFFPEGTYIANALTIGKSTTIYGIGDKSVIKKKAGTDTASPSVAAANLFKITTHNIVVTFKDLRLDGNEANQIAYEPYGYLIRLTNVAGVSGDKLSIVVDNCTFVDATQGCIYADGDTASDGYEELIVRNSRFINGRVGLAQGDPNVASPSGYGPDYLTLTDKVYATITGNSFIFENTLNTGEFSRTAIRLTFETNTDDNADGARAYIDGNYFYGCGRGERDDTNRPGNDVGVIDAYARGRELRISNNLFEQSQGVPIRGKTNCDLVTIHNNVIDSCNKNPGINIGPNSYAQQSGRISITNNIVRQAAAWGITVVGNAGAVTSGPPNTQMYVADVKIANNIIEGVNNWNPQLGTTFGDGIYVRNFRNLDIQGNMIGGPQGRGIYLRGQAGTYNSTFANVTNNRVEASGAIGIESENSLEGHFIISGNTVVSASASAFWIQSASGVRADLVCSNNTVSGANGYGFYFRYWEHLLVTNNHIEGVVGTSRGIYPQDTLITKVVGNTVLYDVTTPLFGGGSAQSAIHDFGNSWNAKTLYSSTVPSTASTNWTRGDVVYNTAPSAAGTVGWVCTTTGTFGTLNGGATTANTTNGSNVIVVNTTTGLTVGNYITVAGAGLTGVRVNAISGTSVTVSANATATLVAAAVSFQTPVFKTFGTIAA